MRRADRIAALKAAAKSRILILDGAAGSMFQQRKLTEADFRGARFADHPSPLQGDNDLLCVTRPDVVGELHDAYLAAGADIVATNTFNATSISQADYALEAGGGGHQRLRRPPSARRRRPLDRQDAGTGPRYVAGSIGPLSRTLSISPDVNDSVQAGGDLRRGLPRLSRTGPGPARGAMWTSSWWRRCSTP